MFVLGISMTEEINSASIAAPTRDLPLVELVESLLFVAPEPVTIANLAVAIEVPEDQIEEALAQLGESSLKRGLRLQRSRNRVQLVTAPEAAPTIERFLGLDLTTSLSPAALETLAIIAYRQPVTRAQIDEWRGVSSDGVLRALLYRELVEQVGRLEQAGRPFQYGTTFQFLQYFGLESLENLPLLEEDDGETQPDEMWEPDHA